MLHVLLLRVLCVLRDTCVHSGAEVLRLTPCTKSHLDKLKEAEESKEKTYQVLPAHTCCQLFMPRHRAAQAVSNGPCHAHRAHMSYTELLEHVHSCCEKAW